VTGFNEEYSNYGLSWLISLRNLAQYNGDIKIFGYDLSTSTKSIIKKFDVDLIECQNCSNIRNDVLIKIKNISGKIAFWDADAWFQDKIDEVFDLDEIATTENQGFFYAPKWKILGDLIEFSTRNNLNFNLSKQFNYLCIKLDPTWNYTKIIDLKNDEKLTCQNSIVKVVHPAGQIKKHLENLNIFFWDRHKDLFLKHTKKSFRKIVL
jgi:hypothetical protein